MVEPSRDAASFLSQSRVMEGMAEEAALTWHKELLGQVVWVPVRDGLGQVVNSHLILLAGFYHKVAEGKTPLKRREEGRLRGSHTPVIHLGPQDPIPTFSPKPVKSKNKTITTTESEIGGTVSSSVVSLVFSACFKKSRPGLISREHCQMQKEEGRGQGVAQW